MWWRAPAVPAAGRRRTGPPFEWPQASTPRIGGLAVQSLRVLPMACPLRQSLATKLCSSAPGAIAAHVIDAQPAKSSGPGAMLIAAFAVLGTAVLLGSLLA